VAETSDISGKAIPLEPHMSEFFREMWYRETFFGVRNRCPELVFPIEENARVVEGK
jgi:hypothetical protein